MHFVRCDNNTRHGSDVIRSGDIIRRIGSNIPGRKLIYRLWLWIAVTTLANYCYQYMFSGCTSLTTAPELPATWNVNGANGVPSGWIIVTYTP